MAAYNKFETFVEHLANKVHDIFGTGAGADTLKVYLSNAAPNAATHAVKADLAEIGAGNGYPAGGSSVAINGTRASGTLSAGVTDVVFTAAGGSIGPFRYVVLYNDTPVAPADPLIAWWDYGSALTLNDGETLTVDFSTNAFTLA